MFVVRSASAFAHVALVAAMVSLVAGCGRQEYEARLDSAVRRLKTENKFTGLDKTPTLIAKLKNDKGAGVEVSFRKPARFSGTAFSEGAALPTNPNEPLNANRIKPPFLQNFPGFQYCYELLPGAAGPSTAYLYVGAQPAEPGAADRLLTEMQPALPDPPPVWNTVVADTPEDTKQTWKALTFTSDQEFVAHDNKTPEKQKATFKLWMCEQNGIQVFLGYRWADRGTDATAMEKDMLAAAGTIAVKTGVKID
jgi:hypothetical protein